MCSHSKIAWSRFGQESVQMKPFWRKNTMDLDRGIQSHPEASRDIPKRPELVIYTMFVSICTYLCIQVRRRPRYRLTNPMLFRCVRLPKWSDPNLDRKVSKWSHLDTKAQWILTEAAKAVRRRPETSRGVPRRPKASRTRNLYYVY